MKLLEVGPAISVPAAWGLTLVAAAAGIEDYLIPPMLGVMLLSMSGFVYFGWRSMSAGALRGWRTVIAAGVPATALGLYGAINGNALLAVVSLAYWLKAPGLGLIYTWDSGGSSMYLLLGTACVLAGCLFDAFFFQGITYIWLIAAAGTAQTLGIWKAVYENTFS